MKWFKTLRGLQKLLKHMKKNDKLRDHMEDWMQNYFKLTVNDTDIFLDMLRTKPENITVIVDHYNEVKHEY